MPYNPDLGALPDFKTAPEWAKEIQQYLTRCAITRTVPTEHVEMVEQVMRQVYDDAKDAVRLLPVENGMAQGCVIRREAERLGGDDD